MNAKSLKFWFGIQFAKPLLQKSSETYSKHFFVPKKKHWNLRCQKLSLFEDGFLFLKCLRNLTDK